MHTHLLAATAPVALSTQGLVTYLQGLFGPLFLGDLVGEQEEDRYDPERARSPLIPNQEKGARY